MAPPDSTIAEGFNFIRWFTADWFTAILLAIALIQPGIIGLWRKFWRKPKLEFHETGKIEIGYTNLGPLVSIWGAYQAINADIFVREINVTIVRKRNKTHYEFAWILFPSTILDPLNLRPLSFSNPSGFLVSQQNPVSLRIVFKDLEASSRLESAEKSYVGNFNDLEDQHFSHIPGYAELENPGEQVDMTQKEAFAQKLKEQAFHSHYFGEIERIFYWEPDTYTMTMTMQTSGGQAFRKAYDFTVTEEDSRSLKLNSLHVNDKSINEFLGRPTPHDAWTFRYCAYLGSGS